MLSISETELLLHRARGRESHALPTQWSDALGVGTVGQVCARIRNFAHDLRTAASAPPHPADLREVYWGDTGVPSVRTLRHYLHAATRHLRDILDDLEGE